MRAVVEWVDAKPGEAQDGFGQVRDGRVPLGAIDNHRVALGIEMHRGRGGRGEEFADRSGGLLITVRSGERSGRKDTAHEQESVDCCAPLKPVAENAKHRVWAESREIVTKPEGRGKGRIGEG